MKKWTSLPALLLLAGCFGNPPRSYFSSADAGPSYEKRLFFAMTDVKADDAQRAKILAVYDSTDPRIRSLGIEAAHLRETLSSLDPRSPSYLTQADPIAQRIGDASSERLKLQSQARQEIAATLSDSQWHKWDTLFKTNGYSDGDSLYDDDRSEGRRRR